MAGGEWTLGKRRRASQRAARNRAKMLVAQGRQDGSITPRHCPGCVVGLREGGGAYCKRCRAAYMRAYRAARKHSPGNTEDNPPGD